MNIDDLTIGEAKKLASMFGDESKPDLLQHLVGKKVLIRDNMAGVFITTLDAVNGKQWRGRESRKIHYWDKAGAVEGVSTTGIDTSRSRITEKVKESNGQDLIQICPMGDAEFNSIMEASVWNPK